MATERIGLILLVCSLLVIGITGTLMVERQRQTDLNQIRAEGATLSRVVSRLALDDLVPSEGRPGLLQLLFSLSHNSALRYARVLDTAGQPLSDSSAQGVIVPPASLPQAPSAWYQEHVALDAISSTPYREFHAPLLQNGKLVGHIHIGFLEPTFRVGISGLTDLSLFALPIFLLVPIGYYLVRREIRPLKDASQRIQDSLTTEPARTVELTASGDVAGFISQFNRFMELAQDRIGALEGERFDSRTEVKVIGYEKARIESVLQSVPEGILVLDEMTVATYANDKLGVMLGIDPNDILGSPVAHWCHEEQLLSLFGDDSGRHGGQRGPVDIIRDTGQLMAVAQPLRSPRGAHERVGTLVLVSDVTGEVNAKKARRDLIAQLSHELKTPLHVINMYSEMLLEDFQGADSLQLEAGNIIHDEVERVTALINNILSLSRIEMGSIQMNRARTRLNDLLHDALKAMAPEAKKAGVTCHLVEPPAACIVRIDKELMRVAVNNLLSNAIKYNLPNGEVFLTLAEDDAQVAISVRDTGIGIATDDIDQIFNKFYRVQSDDVANRPGHGLGLSLAREIVQAHLGELTVKSAPGKGTEFRMAFKKTPILMQTSL